MRATSLRRTCEPSGFTFSRMLPNCSGVRSSVASVMVAFSSWRRRAACRRAGRRRPARSALCDRVGHVDRRQRVVVQLGRVEPDAHRVLRAEHVDVADAVDAAERVLHVRRDVVRDVVLASCCRRRHEADHQQEAAARLGDPDARLLHLRPAAAASASCSLFCTCTCAMSGFVPGANVSVMVAGPESSVVDDRYSKWSSPLICCSITCVTVFSTVSADAPGIGRADLDRRRRDRRILRDRQREDRRPPASMIRIAMTIAKIGRSMKNLAMRRVSSSRCAVRRPPGAWPLARRRLRRRRDR